MSRKNRVGVSRRTFLAGVGAGAALSPFLPLLNASAQEMRVPKRLLLVYTPDGTPYGSAGGGGHNWQPSGSETSFSFDEIHAPLEPHKAKIILPYGLRMSAAGAGEAHAYGMGGLWTGARVHEPHAGADFDGGNGNRTGWGSGPSVDQEVARAFGEQTPYRRAVDDGTPETPYRTLELGVQCGDPHIVRRMIYRGDRQPIHPETNPRAAFDRLFAGSAGDAEARARALAERRGVLDMVHRDLQRVTGQVGSEEMQKIEAHLEGLRAIERSLDSGDSVCTPPGAPMSGTWADRRENFPEAVRVMTDITVRAMACDLTRVASLQLSRGFSGVVHEWLGHTIGHHGMSHDTGNNRRPEMAQIDNWYSQQVAYLLDQLDSIPEAGGTMLDNTLVVWGRELGTCRHSMVPWPVIMAGGASGALRTGRYLNFDDERHAKLLVSICRAMGLSGVNSFGNINADSGPLAGLT